MNECRGKPSTVATSSVCLGCGKKLFHNTNDARPSLSSAIASSFKGQTTGNIDKKLHLHIDCWYLHMMTYCGAVYYALRSNVAVTTCRHLSIPAKKSIPFVVIHINNCGHTQESFSEFSYEREKTIWNRFFTRRI